MMNEEIEKKIAIAEMVLGAIKNVKMPMLVYEEEKEVVREALWKYVSDLEDKLRGR